jgi:sulfur carrier protein ThiS
MKINLHYDRLAGKSINAEKYKNDLQVEVPAIRTVHDLLSLLETRKECQASILVHVKNEPAWNTTRLKDHDSIKLFMVVGGG